MYEIIPWEFTTTGKGDWFCYLEEVIDNVLSNTGMVCFAPPKQKTNSIFILIFAWEAAPRRGTAAKLKLLLLHIGTPVKQNINLYSKQMTIIYIITFSHDL